MGRPSKYREEYCGQLIAAMSKGLTFTAFCGQIGVSKQSGYRWIEAHEEFRNAKKIAEAKHELWMMEKAVHAIENLSPKDFNTTLWYMMMKNMHGWRDKQDVEVSTEKGVSITFKKEPDGNRTS
jgi:hypothetical protein